MLTNCPAARTSPEPSCNPSTEERLEHGEVVCYPTCPFPLPEGDDRRFLLEQQLRRWADKNISLDPNSFQATARGMRHHSPAQIARLTDILRRFSHDATQWLAQELPRYADSWQLDRVSFRPEEEATRRLRLTARNDLLHIDAFPTRPTCGFRILRLFVNVNPTDPRIWVTSDPFPRLLERFGNEVGLPLPQEPTSMRTWARKLIRIFKLNARPRSLYDQFMLRFHNFLKAHDEFQERGPKRYWSFPPGALWLAFTDTTSHAVLRGRYALEHSYFVAPEALVMPEMSPPVVLARACGISVLKCAA